MKCLIIIITNLYFIFGFKLRDINKLSKNSHKMLNNDYNYDVNLLQKYKLALPKVDYNTVLQDIANNKVSRLYIDTNYKQIVTVDNFSPINSLSKDEMLFDHYHYATIDQIVTPNIITKAGDMNIPINFVSFTSESIQNIQHLLGDLFTIAGWAIPVLFLLSFLSGLTNIASNNPMNSNNNFKNRFTNNNNKNNFPLLQNNMGEEDNFIIPNVSLSSWAGSPEVVEECREIISYIEKKEIYNQIGAEMPKGILLEGPPGTGKTLLAKAIATETNSSFISISGSEFVELFVGMGALRVRELFKNARDQSPCIIFIDEIDAVGRQRGAGINMANDEREQTLNQLLYEMDGFNNNNNIVVLAATNRKDVLDQALLRPGRFDRIIRVPLPDKQSREKILDYYIKDKKTDKIFDISSISEVTEGFSGAQLKNLINEAALLSVRNNYTVIQEKYVYESFEKLIVGLIRNNASVAISTKTRVAIHESGHAILSLLFSNYFEFMKASIQPTYNGAGGYTIFYEKPEIKEGGLYTKDMLKKRLIITLGGKAAETLYYGTDFVSLGAIEDLKQANQLAKRMIGNFGMGNKFEVFYNEDISDDSNPFLGKSLAFNNKYSEYTRYLTDKESLDLVKEAYQEAKILLTKYKDELLNFSELLINNTVVTSKDIQIIKEKINY